MYLVKLINNNIETYINTVSTLLEANRITGTIKLGINTIDSFVFEIFPNNTGYTEIHNLKTLVEVINTKTNKTEFKGRVLLAKHKMSDNGLFSKEVTCESELAYLLDSNQKYAECHNITVRSFLELIIDNHNKQVDENKRFVVGVVNVIDNNDSLYRFLGYDKTLDTIKDKLIDRLGGELRIRYDNGIRYLDYLNKIGNRSNTEIRLAKNLKSIEEEKDSAQVITRLIPLGAKIKKKEIDSEGNETEIETEERLTIASVNNNIDYIDDLEAIERFGVIGNTEIWEDVNCANILLTKAKTFLKENNKIKKKYNISALDLSLIGLDIDSIDIYNTYRVINPIMGIDEELRVIEKTIDVSTPQNSNFNVGDKFEDIKQYNINLKKEYSTAKKIAEEANKKVIQVEKYASDGINKLDNTLTTTNENFKDVKKELDSLKSELEIIKNKEDYLFDIRDKQLNSYKTNFDLKDVTVLQSFDIDINKNEIYAIQLKKGTTADLVVTKLNLNKEIIGSMELLGFGHGTNMAIEENGADIYIWVESNANDKGYGTRISRIKYEEGKIYTNTSENSFNLLKDHTNLSPSIDKINNKLCLRSRYNGKVFYTVFNLNSIVCNAPVKLNQFELPFGVEELAVQGHEIYKDYIYIFEGVGADENNTSVAYVSVIDFNGNIKYRTLVRGAEELTLREAEGIKLKQLTLEKHCLYIGFASGQTGERKANIYKYIDIN